MRHIFRSLFQQVFGIHRIRPNHFVRRNPDTQIVMRTLAAQRRNHHMLWQQSRPPPFRNSDIDQRHNGPAQIENARQVRRAKRQAWELDDTDKAEQLLRNLAAGSNGERPALPPASSKGSTRC